MQGKFRISSMPNACMPITPRNHPSTPFSPLLSYHPASALPFSPLVPPKTPLAPSTPLQAQATQSQAGKRKRIDDKENELPHHPVSMEGSTSKKQKSYSSRRNNQQKLEDIFKAIDDANWVLGEFLYHVFRLKDGDGNKRQRSKQHAKLASSFLKGTTRYTPAMIIDAWFRDPDGCISPGSTEEHLMYSAEIPYTEIRIRRTRSRPAGVL